MGRKESHLERRAAELGLEDRVRFLGFVNQSQLPSVYCAADLFVLPSLFEPFGLVVNEAMLCGLPVAVSDRVGAKFDLVRPDENGYVFPAGDVEALAAILRQILPDRGKEGAHGALPRGNAWKRGRRGNIPTASCEQSSWQNTITRLPEFHPQDYLLKGAIG